MPHRLTAALSAVSLAAAAGCSTGVAGAQSTAAGQPVATAAPALAVPATRPRPAPADLLLLRGGGGARAVDAATGAVVSSARYGLPTPAGDALVAASASGRVALVDARHGGITAVGRAKAGLVPAVTTGDGRLVALTTPATQAAASGYLAAPRRVTSITVLGTNSGAGRSDYDLQGNYEPEAFSTDTAQLFLIEYLPATAPDSYRIRALDLASGTVNGVFGPQKTILDERMRGVGRMHVLDQDRALLYTLYRTIGSDQAFVHTLHLSEQWAHCIVLPPDFGRGGADAVIALAPGGTLYAWDGALLAAVDGTNLEVSRMVTVGARQAGARPALAVGPDGTVIAVAGTTVTELDATTLAAKSSWSLPAPVSGISVSPDGRRLYAVAGAHVDTLDLVTHQSLARIAVTSGDRIAAVLRAG